MAKPERNPTQLSKSSRILVLGAGVTGLVAAIGLAQAGYQVQVIGPQDKRPSSRTVALLDGSVTMLRNLGVWDLLEPHAAPLDVMRIVDDTGSLFAAPPMDFKAGEIGLARFGYNIPLEAMIAAMSQVAAATNGVKLVRDVASNIAFHPAQVDLALEGGGKVSGHLLVGADGRASKARRSANIGAREWEYPQVAITAILSHTQPHRNISTEFQTRAGPCTLVPMPAGPDGRARSSLVWLMTPQHAAERTAMADADFARCVERQVRFIVGAMQVTGPRSALPMSGLTASSFVGHRVALLGEAAHVFPPIGAQGLNLGMRDAADLVDCLNLPNFFADPGDAGALARFNTMRQGDANLRTMAVDALNRSLLAGFVPVDFMRGAGLRALASVGPLRRAVMRAGVQPNKVATLMRQRASKRDEARGPT